MWSSTLDLRQTVQKEEMRRGSQAFIPCSYGNDKQISYNDFEKSWEATIEMDDLFAGLRILTN
jgi:hypothetical protein